MTNIVILNNLTHRDVRVQAEASAKFGDNQRFVPVVIAEFPLLVTHYPVLFSKDSETGAFFCGAMLGIDEGENLFLKNGKGHEGYRPLNLQRAPFFVAGEDLAIDLAYPRDQIITRAGEPFGAIRQQLFSSIFLQEKAGPAWPDGVVRGAEPS